MIAGEGGDTGGGAAPEGKDAGETPQQCGLPSCSAEATSDCSACKTMGYCGRRHQLEHWKAHKVMCRGGRKAKRVSAKGDARAGAPGTAAPEGADAGEGSGSAAARPVERTTSCRHKMLRGWMRVSPGEDFTAGGALSYALSSIGESYDDAAVTLALSAPGLDVNRTHGAKRTTELWSQSNWGRSRNVALLLADPRVDPNLASSNKETPLWIAADLGWDRCVDLLLVDPRVNVNSATASGRRTPLHTAAAHGHDRCVELLLTDPRVDRELANSEGYSPLHAAAYAGHPRCVELLLADPRVDPNIKLTAPSRNTPLHSAAGEGMFACVELLLADDRVHVSRANGSGIPPLLQACFQMRESVDQVGAPDSVDPARTFVLMLRSRRVTDQCLRDTIAHLRRATSTTRKNIARQARAKADGEPLAAIQQVAQMVIPVLEAQLQGERRWCAYCLTLTPDKDIDLCSGCHQVGYCRPLNKVQLRRMPHEEQERRRAEHQCQKLHWTTGGHKEECKRWAAEENTEGKAGGVGEGAAGGGDNGAAGGGGGGANRKKKGKKKEAGAIR